MIATLEMKIASLEADVETHKVFCNHIAEVNENLVKKCEEFRASADSRMVEKSSESQQDLSDNDQLRGEIECLRGENENLRGENERLRSGDLRVENESLRKDKEDLVLSQQVLKQEVTKLQEIVFEQLQRNNKGTKCWCSLV